MPSSVFTALDEEWHSFRDSPATRAALARWQTDPALHAGDLDDLIERIWAADPATADASLAALARRSATDHVAARVLLHALRPGLRALTGRFSRGRRGGGVDHELVAIAWELSRTYPIERRPRSIAANILLDTRKRYVAAQFTNDPCVNLGDLAGTSALLVAVPSAEDEVVDSHRACRQRVTAYLAAAAADGTISAAAADVVWRTRVDGEPDEAVAASLGARVRTLQRRRQRAERRLAGSPGSVCQSRPDRRR